MLSFIDEQDRLKEQHLKLTSCPVSDFSVSSVYHLIDSTGVDAAPFHGPICLWACEKLVGTEIS